MFELQHDNVVRIVATATERDKLLKEGFKIRELEQEQQEKPIDEMTVAELKEHAEKNGIDLKEATRKDDILSVIKGGGGSGD